MTENETVLVAVWCARLAKEGAGLNFADAEDRGTFRMLVASAMKRMKWSGMETVAKALCVEKVPRSSEGACRAIADAWMTKLNNLNGG